MNQENVIAHNNIAFNDVRHPLYWFRDSDKHITATNGGNFIKIKRDKSHNPSYWHIRAYYSDGVVGTCTVIGLEEDAIGVAEHIAL